MTNRERVSDTKSLCCVLAELFQVTIDQAAQTLDKHHIASWSKFKLRVRLLSRAIEKNEESK